MTQEVSNDDSILRRCLRAAHRLPPDAQAELAATLLRNLKPRGRAKRRIADAVSLDPLRDMSSAELRVLAEAVIAPGQQQTLQALLDKNRSGVLTTEEEAILDELLGQADQVGLLKARARYTLSLSERAEELPE